MEAFVLGMICAFAYDLYRSVRVQFRRLPFAASFIGDCFFWLVAAAATVLFLFYRRWGEIYAYTYGGLAGGFIFYFYYFSNILFPLWQKGFAFLFRPWQFHARASNREFTEKKVGRNIRGCRIFHPFWRK
ncbi:MAG: hypothetical protein GX878_01925 [Firmicutes bacterium]|nr:hypothetical protein [Bacillota bacterium]